MSSLGKVVTMEGKIASFQNSKELEYCSEAELRLRSTDYAHSARRVLGFASYDPTKS